MWVILTSMNLFTGEVGKQGSCKSSHVHFSTSSACRMLLGTTFKPLPLYDDDVSSKGGGERRSESLRRYIASDGHLRTEGCIRRAIGHRPQ